MGAKDWMVFYAEADIESALRERPTFDREATQRLVEGLFASHAATPIDDVTLLFGNPPDDEVYAAVWPGLTLVCAGELGVDRPTTLDPRFLEAGAGRTIYLHAMHSVVDWFAFAIWDARRRRLMLGRDRLGKKPLFFHVGKRGLSFASELQALLADGDIERRADPRALHAYLALGYVPSDFAAIAGVRKLAGRGARAGCGGSGPALQ